ncbi:hypothetical protein K435DRAFT_837477 [Dendrothele bispora CBS 962.96]|uniref:Uncharacterized protein n=1 Tax=Dendrothele bispora (strain CBS 962.96) TaxID=1314807 RepID=A0A4S8MC49_DENBC|nr:hypothetical protein K435DRAFT_837477 [Dendrothele bispora CBS 962.96]
MFSQFTTVFLFTVSLLTITVLGLEILLPFAAFLPPQVLKTLEWQTYVHSSALAFGAVLFVLYQGFITLLFLVFSYSMRFLKSWGLVVEVEDYAEDEEDTGENQINLLSMKSLLTAVIITLLILNDAIYNRASGSPLIEGSSQRLLVVISRAFPMCIFEIPALIGLVYLLSHFMGERSKNTPSPVDIEAQGPSRYTSDVKIPITGVVPEKSVPLNF